jgi:Putative zinc-finger
MTAAAARHEECWLLLPWLANGRLPAAERARVEEHVRECVACAREVTSQRLLCEAFAEPDRVSYAPGPSFRKLMERIDGGGARRRESRPAQPEEPVPPAPLLQPVQLTQPARAAAALRSAWRPPGLAWAASFTLVVGLALLSGAAYHWSQPLYVTHTATPAANPGVLHIAFERSLPIGEVEELLRAAGARVVEGPGTTGIFGVTPVAPATAPMAGAVGVSSQMRALAARLRADARVRWVEPLATHAAASDPQDRRAPEP